jgi:hypothetical protein
MAKEEDSLAARPYLERQLIVVSQKEIIKAAEEESRRRQSEEKSQDFDWFEFSAIVAKKALSFNATSLIIDVGVEAFKSWSKARESGLPLLPISRQQAEKLSFPPGHPREGIVYVGHPSIPDVYYTMADFHRYMFEHKLSEAIEILMSLGATSIRAEHISGWSRDFSAKMSLPLSTPGATVAAEASSKSKAENNVLFVATLSGTKEPKLPNSLVWYNYEPTWRMIARGRLDHGLRDFSMSLSYLDDFGINLGIKASLAKAGLDLGGKFEGHESTIWKLTGTFGPLEPTMASESEPSSPRARATEKVRSKSKVPLK